MLTSSLLTATVFHPTSACINGAVTSMLLASLDLSHTSAGPSAHKEQLKFHYKACAQLLLGSNVFTHCPLNVTSPAISKHKVPLFVAKEPPGGAQSYAGLCTNLSSTVLIHVLRTKTCKHTSACL